MNMIQTIQAAIGDVVGGRCYPLTGPDKPVLPYVVYMQVSNAPEVNIASTVPIENTRLQVDVFSKTYGEAQDLADQIRSAMLNINVTPLSAGDLYEAEVKLYRVTQDFSVWYQK